MKRSDFKLITDKIIADLNQYDYNYWATREYPLVYEQEVNNLTVQVEIILLELSEIYVHLAVHFFAECYAGIRLPWDPLRPITKTIMVMNTKDKGNINEAQ